MTPEIDFYQATPQDIDNFARDLWQDSFNQVSSFEQAAQYCAQAVHQRLLQADGQTLFALVRVYRLMPRRALPIDLQPFAPNGSGPVWTLFGTSGDEPAWGSRHASRAHKVCAEESSPMFKMVSAQLNLKEMDPIDPNALNTEYSDDHLIHYFHITNAQNNPAIDQEDFAIPYGIRSVIGFGCKFRGGDDCLLLAFSKAPLNGSDAHRFVALSPFVPTTLAYFDRPQAIWG